MTKIFKFIKFLPLGIWLRKCSTLPDGWMISRPSLSGSTTQSDIMQALDVLKAVYMPPSNNDDDNNTVPFICVDGQINTIFYSSKVFTTIFNFILVLHFYKMEHLKMGLNIMGHWQSVDLAVNKRC